jgi:hypothetical protein
VTHWHIASNPKGIATMTNHRLLKERTVKIARLLTVILLHRHQISWPAPREIRITKTQDNIEPPTGSSPSITRSNDGIFQTAGIKKGFSIL